MGTAVIPQSVRSAWDFVERHVPDADLFERLRGAVPPDLHREGRSVGPGGPAGPIEGDVGPIEGPGVTPWATKFLRKDLARYRLGLPAYPKGGYAGRGVVLHAPPR